jgi:hypothetical protein
VDFEQHERALAVICIASVVAVGEVRPDFSQVTRADRLMAHHTAGRPAQRPSVDQYESHVALSSAKQNTVSDGRRALDGGAQRLFLPSGVSLLCSTFPGGTALSGGGLKST